MATELDEAAFVAGAPHVAELELGPSIPRKRALQDLASGIRFDVRTGEHEDRLGGIQQVVASEAGFVEVQSSGCQGASLLA